VEECGSRIVACVVVLCHPPPPLQWKACRTDRPCGVCCVRLGVWCSLVVLFRLLGWFMPILEGLWVDRRSYVMPPGLGSSHFCIAISASCSVPHSRFARCLFFIGFCWYDCVMSVFHCADASVSTASCVFVSLQSPTTGQPLPSIPFRVRTLCVG